MVLAGLIFELHPPNFQKFGLFEDAEMILVPYFANSYGFNIEKNANEFRSILQ